MIDALVQWLLGLPPWVALVMAFLFPALEASIFVGVVIPGEIAVLIAGVIASGGRLELWEVLVVAIAGAVIGDFVGFEVGRRWGTVLLAKLPERLVKPEHVDRGREELRKRGAIAVLVGRWIAALRALMPGLAGMSGMRLRTFVIANAIGGAIWASAVASLGYVAGSSYKTVESSLGYASEILIGVVVLAIVALVVRSRLHKRQATPGSTPSEAGSVEEDHLADRRPVGE
ncbi:DedA family protein [Williamsia serinedens]|uniref:Membrane protein DedA, SNARE-associated domain n=1 Tax=Williamsia serinedens TaxID=391736 RepID=A0ABT1H045_9NOCA|nr:DedA family protein [Williamsia serinedens]MCP2160359.1 membrane protein DedA, SNARE-associated domain [Williamsia serinedens]